jgi:hypothetical protein
MSRKEDKATLKAEHKVVRREIRVYMKDAKAALARAKSSLADVEYGIVSFYRNPNSTKLSTRELNLHKIAYCDTLFVTLVEIERRVAAYKDFKKQYQQLKES